MLNAEFTEKAETLPDFSIKTDISRFPKKVENIKNPQIARKMKVFAFG